MSNETQSVAKATGTVGHVLLSDPESYAKAAAAAGKSWEAASATLRKAKASAKAEGKSLTVSAVAAILQPVADSYLVSDSLTEQWTSVATQAAQRAKSAADANTRLRSEMTRAFVESVECFRSDGSLIKGRPAELARILYSEVREATTVPTSYLNTFTREIGAYAIREASRGADGKARVTRADALKALKAKTTGAEVKRLAAAAKATGSLPEPEVTDETKAVAKVWTGGAVLARVETAADAVKAGGGSLSAEQCDRVLAMLLGMAERVKAQRAKSEPARKTAARGKTAAAKAAAARKSA